MLVLDVARLFVGVSLLAFASYTDWRWRRAPNLLWLFVGLAGGVLLALDVVLEPALLQKAFYFAFIPVFAGLVFGMYYLHLIAGGADAKALVAIAILLPFPLQLGAGFPLATSPLPASFATLGNSLIAFLFLPAVFLVFNAARRDLRLPHALLGYRVPIDRVPATVWPMEMAEKGVVRRVMLPSRFLWTEEDFAALRAAGVTRLWVTPKVPFMIPLLAGFVAAFFAGDVLFSALFQLIRPGL